MKKKSVSCLIFIISAFILMSMSVSAFDYKENDVVIDFLPGDLNCDNRVTSADARICLRAAADLETLTEKQKQIADFDGTGEIDSSAARKILRASAEIEQISYTVNLSENSRIVVGPYQNPGVYRWNCSTDFSDATIELHLEDDIPPEVVKLYDTVFTIGTQKTDNFTVSMVQQCPWNGEIWNSYELNIVFT